MRALRELCVLKWCSIVFKIFASLGKNNRYIYSFIIIFSFLLRKMLRNKVFFTLYVQRSSRFSRIVTRLIFSASNCFNLLFIFSHNQVAIISLCYGHALSRVFYMDVELTG